MKFLCGIEPLLSRSDFFKCKDLWRMTGDDTTWHAVRD